ncbi:MAG: hypothetical protein K2X47_17015 [Bdellovibrionales bacterium]|nr:hypothetical protein [Bdellovibrionales bacterium]
MAKLTFLIVILFSFSASAKWLETDSPRLDSWIQKVRNAGQEVSATVEKKAEEAQTKWSQLKAKVNSWWGGAPEREVASAPVLPAQNPVALQAAPQTQNLAAQSSVAPQAPATKTSGSAAALAALESQKVLSVAAPAILGDKALKRTASGVPIFDLMQTKEEKSKSGKVKKFSIKIDRIPELNIGSELILKSQALVLPDSQIPKFVVGNIEKLATPDLAQESIVKGLLGVKSDRALAAEKISISFLEDLEVVTTERIQAVKYVLQAETAMKIAEVIKLTPEDLSMLRALIMVAKKDMCHVASGLFYPLTESTNPVYKSESSFHLGLCLHEMGLYTESVKRLSDVIREKSPQFQKRAISQILKDLPFDFELDVSKVLEGVDFASVEDSEKDAFAYILAKGFALRGDLKNSGNWAQKVQQKSARYDNAQYLVSVSEYAAGNLKAAMERQKTMLDRLEKSGSNKNLEALVAMNLGRVAFQDRNYELSNQYFLKIPKDNPLWVAALTEMGWSQVLKGDSEGAIGNMYSLHSPFFKHLYKPESFVVRTIGYLNICQYGDAYRSLSQLEEQYRAWFDQIRGFLKTNKETSSVSYQALIKFLKQPNQAAVDGLAAPVLREIGRNKDFLNIQESVNHRVDELEQYGFLNGLIDKDREKVRWKRGKALERIALVEAQIKKVKQDSQLERNMHEWRTQVAFEKDLTEFYQFQIEVIEEGRGGLNRFRSVARPRLLEYQAKLQQRAGKVLMARLEQLQRDLSGILENNELLRYEVFAGSGENIRFHMTATAEKVGEKSGERGPASVGTEAAGAAGKRIHHTAKPQTKALQWAFDGEYWEDEIGHYRSSLKNNCPKTAARPASHQ